MAPQIMTLTLMMCAVYCLFFNLNGQDIRQTTEAILKQELGKSISIAEDKFTIPAKAKKNAESSAKQKFLNDFIYIYKVSEKGKIKAYGFLDNVKGKAMPITFLVVFNTKGVILSSHIVKYREQYGGEVASKVWNKDFKGKDAGSDYTVGKSIDAISGATISANSVSKGIKKLAILFKEIIK